MTVDDIDMYRSAALLIDKHGAEASSYPRDRDANHRFTFKSHA